MSLSLEKFFLKGSKIIACEEVILRFVEREYLRRSQRHKNFQPKINKKLGVLRVFFSDFWGKKLYSCQSQKEIRFCKCLKISGLKEK